MSSPLRFPATDAEKAAHNARNVSQSIRGIMCWLDPQASARDDMEALQRIYDAIERIKAPAYIEGQLRRQSNGRWLLSQQGDAEFSSGSCLEIWDAQAQAWIPTRIEHSRERGGYYRTDGGPLRDGDWVRIPGRRS